MARNPQNIRKAAVLIRSLDAETAARLLAQLPPAEAAAVRTAVQSLGPIDPEEQADVAAELRRAVPLAGEAASAGVELTLSSALVESRDASVYGSVFARMNARDNLPTDDTHPGGTRFEFLEQAPIANLVPYLAREHVQTIAVVLSYLSPARAASVLAALPSRQQADTLERLSVLGETDADSVKVVEQELAAWVSAQSTHRRPGRPVSAAGAILAAADAATRKGILANLKTHKRHLAAQFSEPSTTTTRASRVAPAERLPVAAKRFGTQLDSLRVSRAALAELGPFEAHRRHEIAAPVDSAAERFQFDDLIQLDAAALNGVLRDVDPNVLMLAMAGSTDALVERIAGQMPKRTARAFRRQLRKLGPTRLSDVEQAQLVVARAAASRKVKLASATT